MPEETPVKEKKKSKKEKAAEPEPPEVVLPPVLPEPTAAEDKKARLRKMKEAQAAAAAASGSLGGPTLPRYKGLDWRVDVRSASDSVARMSVPSVLMQMHVEGEEDEDRAVTFELSRESLATMLDGLLYVRDQLAEIAK